MWDLLTAPNDILYLIMPVALASTSIFLTYYFFRIRPYHHTIKRMKQDLIDLRADNDALSKELQEAQKSLSENGQLTMMANLSAGMLHQISQPVTAIYGLVRYLKKEIAADSAYYESIKVIDQQAGYLREILENLTKIYKHKEVFKADVNLNQIVEKSLHLLSDELRIAHIECHLQLTEKPAVIYADAIHIQQVFMNIIINAIQALKMFPMLKKRSLYIYSKVDLSLNEAAVSFKNNGPKISVEQLERIFEPFYSTKRQGGGIGLALCRKLVEAYEGQIVAHTNDGLTEFEITFPLKQ